MKVHIDIPHDYLRYANCWEDAEVLLKALDVRPGDRVLSIGSAGDNCFSLLTADPMTVVAVDVNRVQLFLIGLKRAAFSALSYQEFLSFLGFIESEHRGSLYQKIRPYLEEDEAAFWDGKQPEVLSGIIHAGKFERYLRTFGKRVMPVIHSKKTIRALFSPKDQQAQENFFDKRWNNGLWRMLLRLFFSRSFLGRFGRDPAFMRYVNYNVAEFILDRANSHLRSVDCQRNYFLTYILTGQFGEHLPHYARPGNFDAIKKRLDKLEIRHQQAEEITSTPSPFNKFNLSNIFEYMSMEVFDQLSQAVASNATSGSRYVYWNLMVERNMADIAHEFNNLGEEAAAVSLTDNGFFYSGLRINSKA